MLPTALGVAWLLFTPVCLWALVRGRNRTRLGAVSVLALLELGTITVTAARPGPLPAAAISGPSHEVRPAPQPAVATCEEHTPVPAAATLRHHHTTLRLSWAASPGECSTAKVLLRPKGRKLRIWIHEGTPHGEHKGVRTVPVHVDHGTASLELPLNLPRRAHYLAVDGRTGTPIPTTR